MSWRRSRRARTPEARTAADANGAEVWPTDLHCHTEASFDSQSPPQAVVQTAIQRRLRILAITDHDTLDGAHRARDAALELEATEPGVDLELIIGEEIRSRDGDIIGLYLSAPILSGMSALDTIAAIHEQGGLAGVPHPFDRHRGTALVPIAGLDLLEGLIPQLDYIEVGNARVSDPRDQRQAQAFAERTGLPGVSVSDAHTLLEIGMGWSALTQPAGSADGLQDALAGLRAAAPALRVPQRRL